MAKELRKRGVPPWELQGILGHEAGSFRTTEIYTKYDPSYMSTARKAIDDIMHEVQEKCSTQIILKNNAIKNMSKPLKNNGMVGDTRFELVTSSMSTKVKVSDINGLSMHWLAFMDLSMQGTCLLCIGSVPPA